MIESDSGTRLKAIPITGDCDRLSLFVGNERSDLMLLLRKDKVIFSGEFEDDPHVIIGGDIETFFGLIDRLAATYESAAQ